MRKTILILSLIVVSFSIESLAVPAIADVNTQTEQLKRRKGKIGKDGRYKRSKGFMWGLFKRKKECDCPEH